MIRKRQKRKMIRYIHRHKTYMLIGALLLLLTVYPPFASIVYELGRDFGRSIVHAMVGVDTTHSSDRS